MKKWLVLSLAIGLLGWISLSGMSSSAGLTVGIEADGLWVIGAMTDLSVTEVIDLRVQVGFVPQDVEGLMLATFAVLPHLLLPPADLFIGIGTGFALTPQTFSNGLILEGTAGIRLVPVEMVSIILQARYLFRWTDVGVFSGPLFEGGILINF